MSRQWSPEQLGKWRIRKAQPGERLPWQAAAHPGISCAVFHGFSDDGRQNPCPWDMPSPPWWVWPPGSPDPEGCYSTREHAQAYVNQSINLKENRNV